MTWGTIGNVVTTHLANDSDDPSLARVTIYDAIVELQAVINGRAAASGVAPLNASSKIDNTYLPDTIASSTSTDLTIAPDTGRVVIQDILALQPKSTAELAALTGNAGDISYCSDGDAGSPCIAVSLGETDSNGSIWYKISLGAQISAT